MGVADGSSSHPPGAGLYLADFLLFLAENEVDLTRRRFVTARLFGDSRAINALFKRICGDRVKDRELGA
jgi:hypothetical protein